MLSPAYYKCWPNHIITFVHLYGIRNKTSIAKWHEDTLKLFTEIIIKPRVKKWIVTCRGHGDGMKRHKYCARMFPVGESNIEILNLIRKRLGVIYDN